MTCETSTSGPKPISKYPPVVVMETWTQSAVLGSGPWSPAQRIVGRNSHRGTASSCVGRRYDRRGDAARIVARGPVSYGHYGDPDSGCACQLIPRFTARERGATTPPGYPDTMAAEIHSRPQTARPVLLNKIEGHSDAVNAAVLIPKEDGVITVSEDRWLYFFFS